MIYYVFRNKQKSRLVKIRSLQSAISQAGGDESMVFARQTGAALWALNPIHEGKVYKDITLDSNTIDSFTTVAEYLAAKEFKKNKRAVMKIIRSA